MATKSQELVANFSKWVPVATWQPFLSSPALRPTMNKLIVPHCVSICPVSSRETYNALTNWLTDARTLASPNIVIILCGNKKDLDADREVTFLEASRFAQENGNLLNLH